MKTGRHSRIILVASATATIFFLTEIICGIEAFLPCTKFQQQITPFRYQPTKQTQLCGIKGFRSWFESAFPSAIVEITPDSYPPNKRFQNNAANGDNNAVKSSNNCKPETFDHVLIDANQFLHTTLRKAYNRRASQYTDSITNEERQQLDDDIIEHCLLLFLRELNRITTTTTIPRKSLVVALDGSPGAAKLDTQRRRRYSIYSKAENQEKQIRALKDRGWRDNDFDFSGGGRRKLTLFSKHGRERISLNITPGTSFMDRVTEALLYWAWQRVTRFPRCRVYISPSSIHGEGEVKLLDWVTHGHESTGPKSQRTNIQQNDTVAIIGGDSDLVLMGLVVPPEITHNIHVILPGEKGISLVASIWETTRIMVRYIEGTATYGKKLVSMAKKKGNIKRKRKLTMNQINQVRIDTTLLIILNGNDYLPKLRGARGGFDSYFKVYLSLVKQWIDDKDHGDGSSFLINFDENRELYLNVPFATAFFRALSSDSEVSLYNEMGSEDYAPPSQSEMGYLNNLVESKILPYPLNIETIQPESSAFKQELWEMKSRMSHSTIFGNGVEIVRLTLGKFPDDCLPFSDTSLTTSGKEICTTVLGESDGHGVISRMIRSENSTKSGRAYLFEVPHRQHSALKTTKDRLARLVLEDTFGKENLDSLFGGYSDEDDEKSQGLAPASVASYLGGILWNLETYQHGCCVDYGYDYGKCLSPTPFQIVDYLEDMKEKGKSQLKCIDLIGHTNTTPISDGLSCLAAVPPQAWNIVPEPYSWLVEPHRSESFDKLYNSCFDNKTNAFDMQSFQDKCKYEISNIRSNEGRSAKASKVVQNTTKGEQVPSQGRRIYSGSKYWTVFSMSGIPLKHPFQPPAPFSSNVGKLRRNGKLRVTKFPVKTFIERGTTRTPMMKTKHVRSIHEIPFKTAFRRSNK